MKRTIIIIAISLILIALATYEMIVVKNINNQLLTSVYELYDITIENKDNISTILPKVDAIKYDWDKAEHPLSLMFNHKDLSTITDTLALYRAYVFNNDYDNSIAQISLLKEYAEKNDTIMGFNFQNVL